MLRWGWMPVLSVLSGMLLLAGCSSSESGGGSGGAPPTTTDAGAPPAAPTSTEVTAPAGGDKTAAAGASRIVISTSMGDIKAELYPDKAPATVKNFLEYVSKGHYTGTIFHRVIPTFMIQGGGYTEKMEEKPTGPGIKNEGGNGLKNERGTLAMARTSDPDSASAQFFINVVDNSFLNKDENPDGFGYAVFGKVTEGLEIVDKIKDVETGVTDTPQGPMQDVPKSAVVIKSIKVDGAGK